MAVILTFPTVRRRAFILRNARIAAGYTDEGAQNQIDHLVRQHLKRLYRCGVDPNEAGEDAEQLRTALWVERARLSAKRGDAA